MGGQVLATPFVSSSGEGYEQQMGRWSRRLVPPFIQFAELRGAVRVLDVGCGTGSLAASLAEDPQVLGVSGVDLSEAYVAHARQRDPDPRVSFHVADACALPFRDATFDHAVSMLVLQFVARADLAVSEMCRVTRRGGTIAAATWDTRGGLVAQRMVYDTAAMLGEHGQRARGAAYTRPLSRPGDLVRAWEAARLANVTHGSITVRMDFPSFADFWAPMEGNDGPVAAYIRSLTAQDGDRLREAVRLAYLDGEPDGLRSYAATAWVVKGQVP